MNQGPTASAASSADDSARRRASEERRVVTTLFCDIVGFTALSERHDPEAVDALLRRYYGAARRVVEAYGGTVEKFIGDAVVAVFGVPSLHEDDAERAVRAGLRLVDEIDALAEVGGEPLEVRVGVNTGEALVRLGVDPASGEGFLTGDAVNVAARLQSLAPAMAVVVGEATHDATERVFSFEVCHPVTVKGKSRPLRAWIATAPLAHTGAELRSFTSAFVGREEELGQVRRLLDAASAGACPQFGLVVGEPGIGKSRLLAELARRLDDQPAMVTWRQGRCLPFGSNVTFWALSEIVRGCAGILESDGVARAEARLEAVLPEDEDRDRVRARLRPLLGLESEEASREENFAAWRLFLDAQAASGPTVLVVEDLHWADEAMLAFLDDLAEHLAEVPLLLLATTRPEVLDLEGPGAGFVAAAAQVRLGPLSGEETAELARNCLGATSLPTDLQALILQRSGGNPLFAEELVRLLQDRDLLDERGGRVSLRPGAELPTPDSIGALIAARLDLLSPERKALLADAAVVGRTFWVGAAAAVGDREAAEVYAGLIELVAKELVRPERGSSMEGETEFTFVHALVCDVAYAQLTRVDRAPKHAALARWLEQRTAGRTEDLAEVLAYHYGTALELASSCGLDLEDELIEPAGRYLELAGGRAAPLDASAAAAHFARAELVAAGAQRPRRWLLSRRTRRTLRRRAPLLVAGAAVIAVALVAALGLLVFRPAAPAAPTTTKTLSSGEIADKNALGVVQIVVRRPEVTGVRLDKLRWKTVTESGVLVSEDGMIFTCPRPLEDADLHWQASDVTVRLYARGGHFKEIPGQVVNVDPGGGAAIVRISSRTEGLAPVPVGDSDHLREGQQVTLVSRKVGEMTQSAGVLKEVIYDHDQTSKQQRVFGLRTTALSPLSVYGSALFDANGRLIGIMGPVPGLGEEDDATTFGQCVGLFVGHAGSPDVWLDAASASHWLGVTGMTVSPTVARNLRLPVTHGVLLQGVVAGSPAAKAGIHGSDRLLTSTKAPAYPQYVAGDIIVGMAGLPVRTFKDIPVILERQRPGKPFTVDLIRGNRRSRVTVSLPGRPWWS